MQETQQQQISLPYEELGKPVGRDGIRAAEGVKNGRATYMVPFDQISVRDGFNIRSKPSWMSEEDWELKLQVKELADSLLLGKECPDMIKGDFVSAGPEPVTTIFVLTDGERRYRAIKRLLSQDHTHYGNGKAINMVEVMPNPANYTEFDRNRQFYSSNNNLKYTDLQLAELCWRMKNCFLKQEKDGITKTKSPQEILAGKESIDKYQALTNDDIATELGRSRQWVGNMLILHELPDETKKLIDDGSVNYTDAIKEYQAANPQRKKTPRSVTVIDDDSGEVLANATEGDTLTVGVTSATEMNPMDDVEVERDDFFDEAADFVRNYGSIFSASALQRRFNLGYMRASRLVEQLEAANIIEKDVAAGMYKVIGVTPAVNLGGSAADEAEMQSHKTDPNFKENRPKTDRDDLLEQRNFKTEKDECDMNLNQVEKYLDKLETQISRLPDHVPGIKQAKNDMGSLINGIIRKLVTDTREKIKKAPDKGTIS